MKAALKTVLLVALAVVGTLFCGVALARNSANVYWSVGVVAPGYPVGVGVAFTNAPLVYPPPVYWGPPAVVYGPPVIYGPGPYFYGPGPYLYGPGPYYLQPGPMYCGPRLGGVHRASAGHKKSPDSAVTDRGSQVQIEVSRLPLSTSS